MLFWQLLLQGIAAGAGYALIAVGFALIYADHAHLPLRPRRRPTLLAAYAYYAGGRRLWHWHPAAARRSSLALVIAALFGVGVDRARLPADAAHRRPPS